MAIDFRSQGASSPPDQNYLLRLRERALARMRQDEQAAGVSAPSAAAPNLSRRSSLRMLGLAAVGVTAGALSARAAGVASLRSAAPQYGASVWPGPGVAYERPEKLPEWGKRIAVVSDSAGLAETSSWIEDAIAVLPADGREYSGYQLARLKSRVIYYAGSSGKPHALDAVEDPDTASMFIVPGGQMFYIRDNGDLLGVLFSPTTVTIRKSLFRAKDAGVGETIRKFASQASPKWLAKEDGDRVEIDLRTTLPRDSWSFSPGWMPTLMRVSASGHVLEFEVSGAPAMRVDWRAKKLLTDGAS